MGGEGEGRERMVNEWGKEMGDKGQECERMDDDRGWKITTGYTLTVTEGWGAGSLGWGSSDVTSRCPPPVHSTQEADSPPHCIW